MTRLICVVIAATAALIGGCGQSGSKSTSVAAPLARKGSSAAADVVPARNLPRSSDDGYTPSTPEESVPISAAYMTEVAKVYEPKEMALKPMQVRAVAPDLLAFFGPLRI